MGRTDINGNLVSNGKVVLINPNGVLFGAGSTVNVPSLVASSADLNVDALNQGKLKFDRAGNADAVIENRGTINAADKGLVAFIAPTVINNGIIQAKAGTVKLAAGDTMTVDMYGDGLYSFAVGTGGKNVTNAGKISAEGGTVMLTANAAKDVVSSVVNNTGIIEASSAHSVGGTIVIGGGSNSKVSVSGKLKATGTKGGSVTVTGKNIELVGADIDASGATAGGNVRIGGDYQGGGTLAHADTVTADAATKINVSATESGNGGTAVIWSDKATQFAGSANASAGAAGGNGGLVEVSSKGTLNYTGNTIARGTNGGKNGKLLLDPIDVVIDAALALATEASLNANTDVEITSFGPGADVGNITNEAYISWYGLGTLTLNAVNDIIINNSIIASVVGINGTQGGLILNAGNNISATSAAIRTARGDITMNGKAVTLNGATVTANTGDIRINNTGAFFSSLANAVRNGSTAQRGSVHLNQTQDGSIQNAVDAIGITGWSGAKVTLAAGTWDEQVNINQGNFTLTGQGATSVIRAPKALTWRPTDNNGMVAAVVYGTNGYDINVSKLKVDGLNRASHGIVLNNTGFSEVQNTFVNNARTGILIDNAIRANVSGNFVMDSLIAGIRGTRLRESSLSFNHVGFSAASFFDALGGIYVDALQQNRDVTINNNYVWNTAKGNGITLARSTGNNQVSGNRVVSSKQDSINVANTSNLTMLGNTLLYAEGNGITLNDVSNLNAQQNVVRGVRGSGISASNLTVTQDTSGNSFDNSIQNNTVYETGQNGIVINGGQNMLVNQNTIFNLRHDGIRANNLTTLTDATESSIPFNQNQFNNNTIYQVGRNGIRIQDAENLQVVGNTTRNLGFNGIYVQNAHTNWPTSTLISGNTIHGTGINGIRGTMIENAEITNNTIYNIGASGAGMAYATYGGDPAVYFGFPVIGPDEGDYEFSVTAARPILELQPLGIGYHGIHVDNLYVTGGSTRGPVLDEDTDFGDSVSGGSEELFARVAAAPDAVLLDEVISTEYVGPGRTIISNNTIYGIYQDGIHIETSQNVKASNNNISRTGKDGIYAYNLTVTGSDYDMPSETMFKRLVLMGSGYIPESYQTNEFSHNTISFTGDNGIDLDFIENADVKYNEIHDMESHGILARNLYVTSTPETFRFSRIDHNHVYNTSADGIHVEGIQNAAVDANHVHNVRANGIYMVNYPAGSKYSLPGNGSFNKSSVTNNNVHDVGRDGIFLERMRNVDVITNKVTNVGHAGISVVNTADSSVRLNTVKGAKTGLLFVYSQFAEVLNNIVTGNFVGANLLTSNNALLSGNVFTANPLGIVLDDSAFARIEGGSITTPFSGEEESETIALILRGVSSDTIVKDVAFNGGDIGVLIDGPGFGEGEELVGPSASMQFEGNGSTFTGQNYYFILQNGAMVGDEIDASQQTFDGTRAADFTEEQLAAAEDGHTTDRDDDLTIGNVFYKAFAQFVPVPLPAIVDLAVLDDFQNNIRNRYRRGNFSYAGRAINVVVDPVDPGAFGAANATNLSLLNNSPAGIASQLSALSPAAGGNNNPVNTAQDLANLAPAAGGTEAEQLASLAPAAGGSTPTGSCGNNFLDGGYETGFACSTNVQ